MLQKYTGCSVVCLPMLNLTMVHPRQGMIDPPTAIIRFSHFLRSFCEMLSSCMCLGPPRQIPAPLSGNTLREADSEWLVVSVAGISSTFCVGDVKISE